MTYDAKPLSLNLKGVLFLENSFEAAVFLLLEADFWKKQAENLIQDRLSEKPNTRVAKNIILFIGDGLSVATATAARIYDGQRHGGTGEENQLMFERLDHTALIKVFFVA